MILTIICLITLTSQHVYSNVITINTTSGSNNATCCVDGECVCTSLSTALLYMTSNTVINITSKSVTLEGHIEIGSGHLNNIKIIGNGVTIMCNNNGSVYCEHCNNVIIDGITWDKCGNLNGRNNAGVTFDVASNVSLSNCTFQHFLINAVSLLRVSGNILLEYCNFTSSREVEMVKFYMIYDHAFSSLQIVSSGLNDLTLIISECNIYNNAPANEYDDVDIVSLGIHLWDNYSAAKYYVTISNTNISDTSIFGIDTAVYIGLSKLTWVNIVFERVNIIWSDAYSLAKGIAILSDDGLPCESEIGIRLVKFASSTFSGNLGSSLECYLGGNQTEILVVDSNFTDNTPQMATVDIVTSVSSATHINFSNVLVVNNRGGEEIISIKNRCGDIITSFVQMKVKSNVLSYINDHHRGIITVDSTSTGKFQLIVDNCEFVDNTCTKGSAVLTVTLPIANFPKFMQINNTRFHQNIGGIGIILIIAAKVTPFYANAELKLQNSNFTNNVDSALYLYNCKLILEGTIMFVDNRADNGAAIYMKEYCPVYFRKHAIVRFIRNSALHYGGAIYVDYAYTTFLTGKNIYYVFIPDSYKYHIHFKNNTADIAGNSLYINIPKYMRIESNFTNIGSIMYTPCQWSYYQPVDGELTKITCDYDYTSLNGTLAPLVTSPHELRLYFLNNDGVHISSNSYHNTYYIKNNILGREITFKGAVFDYIGNPAEPTQFSVRLHCMGDSECSTLTLDSDHLFVNNISFLSVNIITGIDIRVKNFNVTLHIVSLASSDLDIIVALVVGLRPCTSHPGFVYSSINQTCVCYDHSVIKCYDTYNEIKRGYWFGSVAGIPTTSLCPNHYCSFINHKETRQGYFELPNNIDKQCEHHRTGVACGECSPGYTLAYDSPDCISEDHCSAGMTVLVVVLTSLYWIAVVVGVFSLMYFNFQLSSGYLYGVIYYYSMVDILLDNNPYISDGVFQFASVLSSFSQLNLKFLQQLCFIKGLSGIDQLFIQYAHAVAVSLLIVVIVIGARCSARVALLIRKCILQVLCLLILLAYTSLASTSLQLLRPIKFANINKVYTYASPHIEYFHDRHAIYGTIAAICELIVVIGLPLFLLLERFVSRKIVVKVMPVLDNFQSCFKLKYRWFAAYYLICRQVIMLIVFVGNTNYYNMLFYLQTACMIIAMIHIWILPYQDDSLNALDGLILLIMVMVVNINIFPFLQNMTTELSIILISLPLIFLCFMIIKKKIYACAQNCHYHDKYNYDFEEEERLLNDYYNTLQ